MRPGLLLINTGMRLFNLSDEGWGGFKSFFIIFLIPFYFILEANNQYWLLIPLSNSIKIGLISFLAILGGFVFLQFFIYRERAVLIVCWLAFHYLYFLIVYRTITSIHLLSFLKQYKFYLPFLFIITSLFVFAMLRLKIRGLTKLLSYVTFLFSALVIVELYKVVWNASANTNTAISFTDKVTLKPIVSGMGPDVFLIMMDEYAGFKPLKEHYDYNNAEFSTKLESMGFFVAKKPRSNYNGTLFSTLSLLNMTYLDTSSMGEVKSPKTYAKVAKAIEENLLFDFFRNSGYKVVNNSFLRIKQTSTKPFLFLPIQDRLIISKTFGYILQSDLLLNFPSNKAQFFLGTFYAKGDSYNQQAIAQAKRIVGGTSRPVFMYTHLMMPHSPYVRDEKGNLRSFSSAHQELKSKKYGNSYIHYLKYCNKVIGQIADSVLSNRKKSIIVLVSDHGNRFLNSHRKEEDDFSNFIAVYSSDKNYKGFADTISLVNVFRLLLKNQFGQQLNVLPHHQINVTRGILN